MIFLNVQPSGLHTGRLYTSSAAFNSSEPCGSEVDEEDEFSPREDSMQSILTCTLSRLNIPSLVDTTSGQWSYHLLFLSCVIKEHNNSFHLNTYTDCALLCSAVSCI